MKPITIILIFSVCLSLISKAGDPKTIPLKIQEVKPAKWYQDQMILWQDKIEQDPDSGENWLNYYLAANYGKDRQALESIIQQLPQNLPSRYRNTILGIHYGKTDQGLKYLSSVLKAAPDENRIYPFLIEHYEILGQVQKRKDLSLLLFRSKLIYHSLLNYSYNVLMSVSENGVLIVNGSNTFIPLIILQDVFNTRSDIKILNLDLLNYQDYRNSILRNYGLKPGSKAYIQSSFVQNLPDDNPEQEFFYALTLPRSEINTIQNQLYVVGLASVQSDQRIDNVAMIKKNMEQQFLLDYLSVDFDGEPQHSTGKQLETNYLVPLLLLKGNQLTNSKLDGLISKLASQTGKEHIVKNFLSQKHDNRTTTEPGKESMVTFRLVDLDLKNLEKSMRKIRGKLYTFDTEVTNKQYNLFLKYLLENDPELHEKHKFDLSQYTEPTLSLMTGYHYPRRAVKKQEFFNNYPAINISHESAIAYCTWLTEQYNRNADRKYKEVKFRLPTLKEWQIAALGYPDFQSWDLKENIVESAVEIEGSKKMETRRFSLKEYDVKYPWYNHDFYFRDKAANSKNCYLGNFKVLEEVTCPAGHMGDGFVMTSIVRAYFSNGMGLYDMVGNISEMIDEEGKSCGGSWNHVPEESTIYSVQEYAEANSWTGFRVFMDIVRE